jgi:zinc transporter, ZIP family
VGLPRATNRETARVLADLLILLAAGVATALATGLGAIPVFLLGARAEVLRPALWGLAAGLMGVASVVGLLMPALDEGGTGSVVGGGLAGVAFFAAAERALHGREDLHVGQISGAGVRQSILVFAVLFVHSLPEGFAMGTAYASETAGLGLFVILAIALQNIPEGTTSAIPMAQAGFSRRQQFWAAVGTSAPQPVGAVMAYLLVEEIEPLLPVSFAFAAGAMLTLVALELIPQAFTRRGWPAAGAGALGGAMLMLALSALIGV